ncbi:MAG: SIS domain-containing protein [Vicinamibacterales bacterium]
MDGPARAAAGLLRQAASVHEAAAEVCAEPIAAAAALVSRALAAGGHVLAFGNGGSAADAQHFVAELVGRFDARRNRRALAAVALASDPSVMTALANDLGFDQVFARQVEALGRPGDVALGLTTSGRSPNVLAALTAARARGMATVALTGRAGVPVAVDVHVAVPDDRTPRVQEVHGTLLHVLCELVEEGL